MDTTFLGQLSSRARVGLAAGAVAIILAVIACAAWLLRTDDAVLFADLRPQDAAAMVAELDKQKIAYRMGADGTTILVDRAIVHTTRMKLLGKDIPLHGAAGFELFNSGDFGMTEFAQKVNYQRALQGEITRTILSLAEVRDARVHLALPEEGLFKRAANKPKAAITLSLKTGQSLRADQVSGIQRLVAGAVAGIAPQDVTIVDDRGVALTRGGSADGEADAAAGARMDLKRDMERLLVRKATEVLERTFGAGQAMASVDVTLNMDQVRVTTEDVIGAPAQAGQGTTRGATGVVVREREVLRDVPPPLSGDAASRGGDSQREVEYQVGRRVEQVITQPGAVRRIHVAAVVRHALDAEQLEQARALVSAAVGGVTERGDTIVVQSLKTFEFPARQPQGQAQAQPPVQTAAQGVALKMDAGMAQTPAKDAAGVFLRGWDTGALVLLAAIVLIAACAALVAARRRAPAVTVAVQPLTHAQRQIVAAQLKLWLDKGGVADAGTQSDAARPALQETRA